MEIGTPKELPSVPEQSSAAPPRWQRGRRLPYFVILSILVASSLVVGFIVFNPFLFPPSNDVRSRNTFSALLKEKMGAPSSGVEDKMVNPSSVSPVPAKMPLTENDFYLQVGRGLKGAVK